MKIIGAPALGLALYVLAGCSGGGSGGLDTSPEAAEINAGNALIVATTTLSALASARDIGAIEDLLGGLANPTARPRPADGSPTSARLIAPLSATANDPCRTGHVSGTVAPGEPDFLQRENRLVPGDRFSLNLADCGLPGELRASGRLDVRVDRFVGTLDNRNVEYLYASTLHDLRIDTATASHVATGDMQMFFGSTSFPMVFAALAGQRLAIAADGKSTTLRDYDLASQGVLVQQPEVFGSVDTLFDGHLSSSQFAGEVRFQTQVPFRTTGRKLDKPSRGQVLVFGAGGAVLRLTVAGKTVQLELDADGNGGYEHHERASWASLTGSG